jgi:PAS domain-containing protein
MFTGASSEFSDIFSSILKSVPVGIIVADLDGKFLYFNREAEIMLGIGSREISPDDWARVYGCYLPDMITPYPTEQLPLLCTIRGELVADKLIFIKNATQSTGLWTTLAAGPGEIKKSMYEAKLPFSVMSQIV